MLSRSEAILKMNEYGARKIPYFFFTDFRGSRAWVKPISAIDSDELAYHFGDRSDELRPPAFSFEKSPLSFVEFKPVFDKVVSEIKFGNSFLVNLTFKTPIQTNLSLSDIFRISKARYKLRYRDQFVVFSPESFIQIKDGNIFAYPMKGTIDASIPMAERLILDDPKETAEHVTIVDLIRNDLSLVAKDVEVTNFRFISEVQTHEKKLLQVSSEIKGSLPVGYQKNLGTLLFDLLPAGSITGAPKPKTVEIIEEAESYIRGFYTGVCGLFDGKDLDTGVMIRFIEKEGEHLCYKSGGGITSFSSAEKEYQEIIDKIYVPVY